MAKFVSCKHCDTKGLRWQRTDQGFRLYGANGKHSCLSKPGRPSMEKAITTPSTQQSKTVTKKVLKNRQRLEGVLLYEYVLDNGILEELGVK